jgi:hypothetical protein
VFLDRFAFVVMVGTALTVIALSIGTACNSR